MDKVAATLTGKLVDAAEVRRKPLERQGGSIGGQEDRCQICD